MQAAPVAAMRLSLVLLMLFVPSACMRGERPSNHADWLRETTRSWQGETRARVIAAAEAVIRHPDPGDTTVEYGKAGFTAKRRFALFAVIAAAEGEDRWRFAASENEEGASASVGMIQRGRAYSGSHSQRFRDNHTEIGAFRLFYARIDYLLGRRPDWVSCADAPPKLGLPAAAPGTDALCGMTLQNRDAPPPGKVAAKSQPAAKPAPKSLPEPPQLQAEDPD